MPISLESNSATMLINQYAHGLAGKPPFHFAFRRVPLAIAHPQRTNNGPFCTGPCSMGRVRSACHSPPPLRLVLSLALSLSLFHSLSLSLVRSFPLPVVHRSTDHLPLQFLAAFDISDARGSRPGEITEPSRTGWNLRSRPSESKARNRRVAIALRSFRPTFLRSSIRSEYDETYDIYARPRSRLVRADSRVPDCISVCTFARF